MLKLLITIFLFGASTVMWAQDTTDMALVKLLPSKASTILPFGCRVIAQPVHGNGSGPISVLNMPTTYGYTQGKLPLFCAFEDLIWRRTGLGMQFRLIDRPLGFR